MVGQSVSRDTFCRLLPTFDRRYATTCASLRMRRVAGRLPPTRQSDFSSVVGALRHAFFALTRYSHLFECGGEL